MSLEPGSRFQERRTESRSAANGSVKLRPDGFAGTAEALLLDRSAHGFRARHAFKSLTNGQFVDFEHDGGAGRARVIWTRIAGDQVESGFLATPESPVSRPCDRTGR